MSIQVLAPPQAGMEATVAGIVNDLLAAGDFPPGVEESLRDSAALGSLSPTAGDLLAAWLGQEGQQDLLEDGEVNQVLTDILERGLDGETFERSLQAFRVQQGDARWVLALAMAAYVPQPLVAMDKAAPRQKEVAILRGKITLEEAFRLADDVSEEIEDYLKGMGFTSGYEFRIRVREPSNGGQVFTPVLQVKGPQGLPLAAAIAAAREKQG